MSGLICIKTGQPIILVKHIMEQIGTAGLIIINIWLCQLSTDNGAGQYREVWGVRVQHPMMGLEHTECEFGGIQGEGQQMQQKPIAAR